MVQSCLPLQLSRAVRARAPEHHTKIGFQGRFWSFLIARVQQRPAVLWVKARLGRGAQEEQTNQQLTFPCG